MSVYIINVLKKVPLPLFGNAATAAIFSTRKAGTLTRLAPWGVPLGGGALWFVWPAVDQEWKDETGFGSARPAVLKEEEKIELSDEAISKIESAYVVDEHHLSEEEQSVMNAMAEGDFTSLEKDWDEFQLRASNPNDDDDDDDDDDDEDDDEEDDEDDDDEGADGDDTEGAGGDDAEDEDEEDDDDDDDE